MTEPKSSVIAVNPALSNNRCNNLFMVRYLLFLRSAGECTSLHRCIPMQSTLGNLGLCVNRNAAFKFPFIPAGIGDSERSTNPIAIRNVCRVSVHLVCCRYAAQSLCNCCLCLVQLAVNVVHCFSCFGLLSDSLCCTHSTIHCAQRFRSSELLQTVTILWCTMGWSLGAQNPTNNQDIAGLLPARL